MKMFWRLLENILVVLEDGALPMNIESIGIDMNKYEDNYIAAQ